MSLRVFTRRLSFLGLAAAIVCLVAALGGTAQAQLLWYDGFEIGDGTGATYTPGLLAGQTGGSGTFFTGPWEQANAGDITDSDSGVSEPGLHYADFPDNFFPQTGGKTDDLEPVFDCCHTSRSRRTFATPFVGLDDTIYMSFLVNFGKAHGHPHDFHYRSVEWWNGGVGDSFLNMSLGFSTFGNYNDPVNGPAGANEELSLGLQGHYADVAAVENRNYQLGEHLSYADQEGQTHLVVLKWELSTLDAELFGAGFGDKLSVYLNPSTTDPLAEASPSLFVDDVDINLDSMSSMILFHFIGIQNVPGALDEIRVGKTWGDVVGVPEPATFSLLGLGAIGLLLAARRKRA